MLSNNFIFNYAGFPLTRNDLETYVNHAINHKKSVKDYKSSYNHSSGVVDCIISCIASNDFSFDKDNKHIFKILYTMLRDYAHDNGKYTDEARTAMRILCSHCGFAPDSIVLIDRKPMGRMERLKKRFSKWFGSDDEHDAQEDKIDQMFAEIAQQKSRAKHDALVAEAEKRRAELKKEREKREQQKHLVKLQQPRKKVINRTKSKPKQQKKAPSRKKTARVPVATIVPVETKKTKHKFFAKISATITGFVALGAAMVLGTQNSADITTSTVNNNSEPTFKNVYVDQSTHYSNVSTYNMIDSLKKQQSDLDSVMQYRMPSVVKSQQQTEEKQIAQTTEDQELANAVTKASRTALDILIGIERAQKLCDKVEAQVKDGIFTLPEGMSVERVAHAMEMSRIYEGNSVILDALKSNVKLTAEQQQAFDDHIASIGDLGVKLQQRMASQHKLNNHSRYDKAAKNLQMAHAKNLKQLRQIKNRTR